MRVLYSFPHTVGNPGIATTAYHQIQGLVGAGVTVDVVCTSAARDLPGVRRVIETMTIRGRRVPHRVIGVYRAYARHDRTVARLLELLRHDVDLVHCWPAGCLNTLGAAPSAGVTSFREVPSAHTEAAYADAALAAAALGMELPADHHHRYDAGHLARELAEFAAAEYLLVPSAYVEETFLERGHPHHQLIRHGYGFDPATFAEAPRPHSDGPADGLTAVFVGRGEPNKGLHHALRAWIDSGAAQRGRFLICGDILPAYRARIAPLLAHTSVQERGFVADVDELMRSADLLVLPSVSEGSALVTYEAQAAGCALLVSEAAGAPCEHLREGLIHSPGDVEALTGQLRTLDRDRDLLARLQRNARENARGLTWAAAGKRLAEAYATGLQRKTKTRRGVAWVA